MVSKEGNGFKAVVPKEGNGLRAVLPLIRNYLVFHSKIIIIVFLFKRE